MDEWQERGVEFFRQNKWLTAVLVIGLFFLVVGRVLSFINEDEEVEIINSSQSSELSNQEDKIWVDVEGAVVRSGVYELSSEARVKDALAAAGGLSEEADRNRIARSVNLAGKVKDGDKIYFVKEGEAGENLSGTAGSDPVGGGLVNVNTASVAELDKLWGVGPARAEQIISGRPYASIEELKTKGSVPTNVFERIRNQVEI